MAILTIRDLDDDVVAELKQQAKENHRSLAAEVRALLSERANYRQRLRTFAAKADRIAAMTPDVPQTDSTLLIREDRDR